MPRQRTLLQVFSPRHKRDITRPTPNHRGARRRSVSGVEVKLTRVTITGADDGVPHRALAELREQFPFVEWGLLLSKKRFGEPRYPSTNWLLEIQKVLGFAHLSFHLCGAFARRVMCGDPTMVPREVKRMQLNGFGSYRLPGLLSAEMCRETEFILQCGTGEAMAHAVELRQQCPNNVVALWDPSGGLGVSFAESGIWYPRASNFQIPIGYAGGINEFNIEDTIASLCDGTGESLWVDLETGARTHEDKFDLAKVRRILELAAPFVVSP